MMRCFAMTVAALAVFLLGHSTARIITKRQGNAVDFRTEFYRIGNLKLQTEIRAFQCFARLYFQDQNPNLNLDSVLSEPTTAPTAPATSAAPLVTEAPAPRSAEVRKLTRQSPPAPLERWQMDVLNGLSSRYNIALNDLRYCEGQQPA